MSIHERFELLVSELGPALELPRAIPDDAAGEIAYRLPVSEDDEFQLTLLEDKESLLFRLNIGEVASAAHYRSLLAFNALHETTGGVRMGLDDQSGEIKMCFETPLEELTIDRLRDYLLNLAGVAGLWREAIANDAPLNQLPLSAAEPSGSVRV